MNEMQHPIQGLMKTALEQLNTMVDVNTIVGTPVPIEGGVIIPISKVGFGFAAGGSEFTPQLNDMPFGGGSGAGVSIAPIAFLVVHGSDVRLLHVNDQTHILEKVIDVAPEAIDKIRQLMKKQEQSSN